jgi:hypothetical protein
MWITLGKAPGRTQGTTKPTGGEVEPNGGWFRRGRRLTSLSRAFKNGNLGIRGFVDGVPSRRVDFGDFSHNHEAHLPAASATTQAHPRVSRSHAHARRSRGARPPSPQAARAAHRVGAWPASEHRWERAEGSPRPPTSTAPTPKARAHRSGPSSLTCVPRTSGGRLGSACRLRAVLEDPSAATAPNAGFVRPC